MPNRYPLWKYFLMLGLFVLALIYAMPNLYGDDPAVQISANNSSNATVDTDALKRIEQALQTANLSYEKAEIANQNILVRFANSDTQLKAQDIIRATLGDQYSVALNLASRTPHWLIALGAEPMKLGLDLQGGVHFLLNVDVDAVIKTRLESDLRNVGEELRAQNIRYSAMSRPNSKTIIIDFRDAQNLDKAYEDLSSHFADYIFTKQTINDAYVLQVVLKETALNSIVDYSIDQTITTLRKRVNELGVSEAIVQRQGRNNVSIDLPGVQDTARARSLIGSTATLKFQLVDIEHDAQSATKGVLPIGDQLYQYEGQPVLLKNQVILTGSSITYATGSMGQDGRPSVNVRLGGGGESTFNRITGENIGKPMAVVYVETKSSTQMLNGKAVTTQKQEERIISIATIQSALGNNFVVSNLNSMRYAENLALLLRSGALAAPVDIIQERIVGPSLGKANIHKGLISLIVGTLAVVLFMGLYYRLFGLIANTALLLNIIFIAAIMSLIGGVLTLPGMAGIVLTVGMAVDANVLINERIREELRSGLSPHASIQAGYDRAFSTIIDANLTTLIVAMILFALGSGPVKAFAVVLSIGILTSMVTAIFFTRGIVNLIYGRRSVKKLSIGI